jgi:hypothetical protein
MGRHFICVFMFLAMLAGAANAQMSEKWLKQEDAVWPIAKKACKDENAFKQLKDKASMGEPIASYWVYRTMTNKRCVHYTRTRRHWDAYLKKAAEARFPRAMSDYGKNLLYGYGLERRNVRRGLSYLEGAVSAGYAGAAGELAYAYGKGNVLPYKPELALQYLDRAVRAGLTDANIQAIRRSVRRDLQREIDKTAIAARKATGKAAPVLEKPSKTAKQSGKTQQTANNSAPSASPSSSEAPKYAVLAVSKTDAAFGWAYDFKNRDEAQKRALNECRKRNGKDCDVKLILRGGGCIAYRYKPGQSVYGWGVSRQRSPAQNRAADECSKRNANQECDAHAWACNSTTKAKLVVELEKDMSPVLRAAADGVACNFIVHTNCQIPGRKLQTMFAYESFRTGKKLKFPGFSNCKEARKTGKIIYREIGGKPIIGMEQVFEPQRERILSLVSRLKAAVQSKHPGCKSKYAPLTVDVWVGGDNKTRISSKPSSFTAKDGTPRYRWFDLE